MDLIENLCKCEFGIEGKVYFKLFDSYIKVNFDEDIPIDYVENCVRKLNSLYENIIATICKYSMNFCKDVMKNYDDVDYNEGLYELSSDKDILKYIQPIALIVDEPKNYEKVAINLYCKCPWDNDNDMQILINDDKVVYIGIYDGLDPWQNNLSEWCNYVIGYRL